MSDPQSLSLVGGALCLDFANTLEFRRTAREEEALTSFEELRRWTARGTNTGTGNGIPATGKSVETSGCAIFRFEDGKVAEEWVSADSLSLMRQLGLLPQPGANASPAPATRSSTSN